MKSPFPVLMARLPMLILALVIASFANRAEPQTFETQQWQQGYSIIDSQWRFHPGTIQRGRRQRSTIRSGSLSKPASYGNGEFQGMGGFVCG